MNAEEVGAVRRMRWKIPLFRIYYDEEDIKSVTEAIKAGMYWAEGPCVKEFENKIREYIGTKYCVVFNSGTSALHASLLALGIEEGSEVIVPSFTFIATANAPLFVGAKPVFADIEEETLGLNPEDVVNKISNKTKAIIPIHYGGCPCRIKELREIAEDYHIALIEDAAEAFGAEIEGEKVGTFGTLAIFSFCQNKIITTGEGGCVVTDSRRMYEKLRLIRSHGRLESQNYFYSVESADYVSLGFNLRMSNILAALGLSQLKKIDKIIKMRAANARYMTKRLKNIDGVVVFEAPHDRLHVYQMYTIFVEKDRDNLAKYLAKKGIMTKVYFPPVHLTPFYRRVLKKKIRLPKTEKISQQVLSLPMYPSLTKEEMDYITNSIGEFFRS